MARLINKKDLHGPRYHFHFCMEMEDCAKCPHRAKCETPINCEGKNPLISQLALLYAVEGIEHKGKRYYPDSARTLLAYAEDALYFRKQASLPFDTGKYEPARAQKVFAPSKRQPSMTQLSLLA